MAEGDRDAYRREQAAVAREKEIMKDVKGWEVSDPCRTPMMCTHDTVDCDLFFSDFYLSVTLYFTRVTQAGKSVYHSSRYRSPEIVIL